MKNIILALFVVIISSVTVSAQEPKTPTDFVEVRASSTQYGYVDWVHTVPGKVFGRTAMTDVTLIKTPGSTELNIGAGLQFGPVAPFVYAVTDFENKAAGVKVAALVTYQKKKFKLNAFAAHFMNFRGHDYQVIDTADATWAIGNVDLGVSMGLFHQAEVLDLSKGGTIKWSRGNISLAFSARRNSFRQNEYRVGLILTR